MPDKSGSETARNIKDGIDLAMTLTLLGAAKNGGKELAKTTVKEGVEFVSENVAKVTAKTTAKEVAKTTGETLTETIAKTATKEAAGETLTETIAKTTAKEATEALGEKVAKESAKEATEAVSQNLAKTAEKKAVEDSTKTATKIADGASETSTKDRVLSNIAESKNARESSNFKQYAAKEKSVLEEVGGSATKGVESTFVSVADVEAIARNSALQSKGLSSVVGHALDKHAGRHPEIWGKTKGGNELRTEQAMKHFDEIINAPGDFQRITTDKGINFLEKRLPDGRGIRLEMNGKFKGFIDPK